VIFPTISVDRSYGESVTSFDVDVEEITDYLRNRGMDDEAISNLTIHFSPEKKKDPTFADLHRIFGQYDTEKNHIEVYRPKTMFAYSAPFYEGASKRLHADGNTFTNKEVSSTLVHEFEHYLDDVSGELDDEMTEHHAAFKKDVWKVMIKRTLGSIAIGGGFIGADYATRQIVADTIDAQGGDATWPGLAIAAVGTAAALIAIRRNNKAAGHDIKVLRQAAYEVSPIEVKARSAASAHDEAFVEIEARSEPCENVEQMVISSLKALGEQSEIIMSSVEEPNVGSN
jgi:hypothetical protein